MWVPARCLSGLALYLALLASNVRAEQTIAEPFLGIRHIRQVETAPRPLKINVVEIDLDAPGISFRTTPRGPSPQPVFGGIPDETIRQTTRQFANAVEAQVAINGSFYASHTSGGMLWANNLGLTASNGDKYSPWESPFSANFDDALNITEDNQAAIVKMPASIPTGFETNPTVTVYNAVTGSHRILAAGANVAPPPGAENLTLVHPRTAVGVTADNKLLMMTVDGRQTGFSEGVNLVELANLMLSYGARDAINLDGGGSTTMVMDYDDDALAAKVVNSPSDGSERSVGMNLAVFALPNGDYNHDGSVDAADYVVWRDADGEQSEYDAWKANFGATRSGFAGSSAVPEPAAEMLALFAAMLVSLRARRTTHEVRRDTAGWNVQTVESFPLFYGRD